MKRREPAWRVFAGEYNDSTVEIKKTGEKTPSYVVTPLGGKVNRLFVVGVLTDVENVSENGDFLRAHISDPTGVFTVYSGQYQPEATAQLLNIEVPSFVGVVGKVRTFEPEEGTMYVSIRPEIVRELNVEARDRWIIETCMQTKHRIVAITEAMKMNPPNVYDLRKLGYSRDLSEGVVAAFKHYGTIDVGKYLTLIRESLQYITPGGEKLFEPEEVVEEKTEIPLEKEGFEETEDVVFQTVKEIEGEDGAAWDLIVEKCKKKGLDENTIEEALTSLMDKGFIFEPVLGTIKTT
jgi:hypothetical protein